MSALNEHHLRVLGDQSAVQRIQIEIRVLSGLGLQEGCAKDIGKAEAGADMSIFVG